MTNGITSSQPKGLLRFLFRLPVRLYQLKLGWLMGKRFLMMTHIGRKSGQTRQVVLEVVSHDQETGAYFVAAAWRHKADWFKNIKENPGVQFTVRVQTINANAKIVEPTKAADIFLDYAQRYPLAFRELSRLMMGETLHPNPDDCQRFAQLVPLVKLIPSQPLI